MAIPCAPNAGTTGRAIGHHLEQRVMWQMLQRKLALAYVPPVRLAQHGVPKSWDNFAAVKGLPEERPQVVGRRRFAVEFLQQPRDLK